MCGLQNDRHGMGVWKAPLLGKGYNHFVTAIHLFASVQRRMDKLSKNHEKWRCDKLAQTKIFEHFINIYFACV